MELTKTVQEIVEDLLAKLEVTGSVEVTTD